MVLSPLSAQAGPNRPFAPQGNRQAFAPPQSRGPANVWNRQPHHYQQPRGHAYGWNGHNRQWAQHRNAYGRNDPQWQPPRNWGQHNNPGSSYNRAGHPTHPQSPNITPNPSGYSHTTPLPAGQTGERPGFRRPDASGNTHQPHGQSPSGVI